MASYSACVKVAPLCLEHRFTVFIRQWLKISVGENYPYLYGLKTNKQSKKCRKE